MAHTPRSVAARATQAGATLPQQVLCANREVLLHLHPPNRGHAAGFSHVGRIEHPRDALGAH